MELKIYINVAASGDSPIDFGSFLRLDFGTPSIDHPSPSINCKSIIEVLNILSFLMHLP